MASETIAVRFRKVMTLAKLRRLSVQRDRAINWLMNEAAEQYLEREEAKERKDG